MYSQKPKIIIACPTAPGGGPTHYASELAKYLPASIVVFNSNLPSVLRHFLFWLKLVFARADVIIALDNFSVALPTVLTGKRAIVRVGGDFLWESYVNRTAELVPLSKFYNETRLNLKEKIIKKLTQFIYNRAHKLVFSTDWQREIASRAYKLDQAKISVISNYFGEKKEAKIATHKNFLWVGRDIPLKNLKRLEQAFASAKKINPEIELDIYKNLPQETVWEKLASCYAFILPSISEVSPNLVLQALQYSKPVIMTRESGFADMLADTVMLVDPMSETDLCEKIINMSDQDTYKMYQEKAHRFNTVHMYQDIAQEFLQIMDKKI
ncbi:MAG TPA: glycosyltransferase family 4 protein [Candidatus Paceibacterota bacterium]